MINQSDAGEFEGAGRAKCRVPNVSFTGERVMVVCPLIILKRNCTATIYYDIIENCVLPNLRQKFEDDPFPVSAF